MPDSPRRDLPDNLDPLVDTLSNVVGILIIVVVLTQLQVGDAVDRLIALEASSLETAAPSEASDAMRALEAEYAELSERLGRVRGQREALQARGPGDLEQAIAAAETALIDLRSRDPSKPETRTGSLASIERQIALRTRTLETEREALDRRSRYADEIQRVPKELVARLPDPGIVRGEEAWILCRYGRCFLADRPRLIQAGSQAIGQIIVNGNLRTIRADEFESVALQLRKRNIGVGNFRWRFVTNPEPRARLEWRSRDPGIERTRLASSKALQSWLANRSPKRDFIRFQVWNDSFEVYLEARQQVEAAGFRAGWDGFDEKHELDLYLTFGRPPARDGPVEVD